ncbi:hypothetical protein [Gimesia maris]|mgnify:FL=1|uniref:Uncharacterized protein n=1 Tax=Gimesia maris TaxID=122 RepID=A0A3D3RE44_9PLAN|nr:hypothetical protein [Gimesia maris]HAW27252.1 hypothetical protein [Planctomycetaceae bacterium]EDL62410.1 hypothetical protein PM8797T_28819 [Gimesia maris DSM 8797]QDT79603.1 hypothetical protein Mal35_30670 [Gimesia maris]QDU15238.1 hypothetical protein CA11_30580 [Gimesia maris]QEG17203.1 hypothetical protein GmarT_30810 [Gimesia maris]|tara:strand:- start:521 stop:1009 length:489 start_codon:yes stop_codon:yes gene_type:complete
MDYHLKPLGKTCSSTGKDFVPGELVHSVIVEKNGQLIRMDFSEEAWSGPPEGAVGEWKLQVPEAVATGPKKIDPDALMQYFEQLYETPNQVQEKFLYVLALFLVQKRRLKLEGSRSEDQTSYLQLSGTHGEGNFDIRDQNLEEAEIEALQQQLNTQFLEEWE